MAKRSRGNIRAILENVEIDRNIIDRAILIFENQMNIKMPRNTPRKEQLCLVCIYKAAEQLNIYLSVESIGQALKLDRKNSINALSTYTDYQCEYSSKQKITVFTVKEIIGNFCQEFSWTEEDINSVIEYWELVPDNSQLDKYTNMDIAAGFLCFFVENRGFEITKGDITRITKASVSKIDIIKKIIEKLINS